MQPGVNLVGFLEAESGLGEIARRVGAAIECAGIPLAAIPYRGTPSRLESPVALRLTEEATYDTNILCMNAHQLLEFAADVGSPFFARRFSIGLWFWETNVVRPADRAATRFLDEIWVASEYVREAVAADADVPVDVMPVPMEPPIGPFMTRDALGLPAGFIFLFVFDFISPERKNPAAVVEAFSRAFSPGEGPILVVKSINGREREPERLGNLVTLTSEREDIVVRDGYVSAAERDSYIATCDCYVSLHRSEGLGLTIAEAMACGKPVIATGYSGNLEFMTEENSHLVPYRLVDVPETWWAHVPGAQWAEPDIDAAALSMRAVWERQDEARALGLRARDEIFGRFTQEHTSSFVETRLADARSRGAVDARVSAHDSRPAILDATRMLATEVSAVLVHAEGSRRGSSIRWFLTRALWPALDAQRRIDNALLDSLVALQRSTHDLECRVRRLEDDSARAGNEAADA